MKKEEYTKQAILSAILDLLKCKKLEEISITELVTKAQVGRASFYRNFNQKEDVLINHLNYLFAEWGKEFEKENNPDVNSSLLRHFWKEKSFYLTIYNARLGHYIYEAMKTAMHIEEHKQPIQTYLASWYAGGIYGFIDEWMKNGMKENPEELSLLMNNLFAGNNNGANGN